MAYLVLARKYRPQTFGEVYAQDHITQILQNTIELNRTAHAYLFTGPRGVGKTSMARIFAKSLNCLAGGPTISPCNKCQNCMEITQGISSDVIEIDGASNTGVDDIRDLQKELMYSPSNSNFKIYIIDEVHMLSKNAFNALLKTLEEPPERVIFIFATTEPHKVLPTIISRCQRFDFKRIPISEIVSMLQKICTNEKIDIEENALLIIAKRADGSMRDAESLLDQILAYGKDKIKAEDVLAIFGMVRNEIYFEILKAIKDNDASSIITKFHQILEKGRDIQEFLFGLMEYIRNLLLLKMKIEIPEFTKTDLEMLDQIKDDFSEKQLLYMITLLMKTKADIKTSNNPILIVEITFLKLAKIDEMVTLEKVLESMNDTSTVRQPVQRSIISDTKTEKKLHRKTEDKKTEILKEAEAEKPKFKELTIDIFNAEFESILEKIKKKNPFISIFLKNCEIEQISNNKISFIVNNSTEFKRLKDSEKIISGIISKHFNKDISVAFQLIQPKKKTIKTSPTLDDLKKESPRLAEFAELFDAEIKSIRDKF